MNKVYTNNVFVFEFSFREHVIKGLSKDNFSWTVGNYFFTLHQSLCDDAKMFLNFQGWFSTLFRGKNFQGRLTFLGGRLEVRECFDLCDAGKQELIIVICCSLARGSKFLSERERRNKINKSIFWHYFFFYQRVQIVSLKIRSPVSRKSQLHLA